MFVYGYQSGIGGLAEREIADAKGTAERAKTDVEQLELRLERALLGCEAMWSLLRDHLKLTDEALLDRIYQLDISDGKLDGRARKATASCPSCKRTISPRFPRCMYCGQEVMHDPFA